MKKIYPTITTTCLTVVGMLFLSACVCFSENNTGFKPLFTATNRADWYIALGRGPLPADTNQLVKVEQNLIHMYWSQTNGSLQPFGYIATKREFSDYNLRFEYRWGTKRFGSRTQSKRDAGVIYHMFGQDNVWPNGVEC